MEEEERERGGKNKIVVVFLVLVQRSSSSRESCVFLPDSVFYISSLSVKHTHTHVHTHSSTCTLANIHSVVKGSHLPFLFLSFSVFIFLTGSVYTGKLCMRFPAFWYIFQLLFLGLVNYSKYSETRL